MGSNKFLDFFLLPKHIYQKLTDKKGWLYLGIIFVGVCDLIFTLINNKAMIFGVGTSQKLYYNMGLIFLFILIMGFVDVLIFSRPLFDFFKYIKKDSTNFNISTLTRFTKTYVLAHILVIPFDFLVNWLFYNEQNVTKYPSIVIVMAVLYSFFIMPAWFAGILSRGANVIFGFDAKHKPLVFASIFTWNFIISTYAFSYIIDNWILWFFR